MDRFFKWLKGKSFVQLEATPEEHFLRWVMFVLLIVMIVLVVMSMITEKAT